MGKIQIDIGNGKPIRAREVEALVREDLARFRPKLLNRLPMRSTSVSSRLRRAVFRCLVSLRPGRGSGDSTRGRDPQDSILEEAFHEACLRSRNNPEEPWGDAPYLICLSFDIDSSWSLRNGLLRHIAEALAAEHVPATFFVVGRDYVHDDALYDHLRGLGHEIGLHGIHHNYRDAYLPRPVLENQLDRLGDFIGRHAIRGYRSPCYLKSEGLVAALRGRFLYDSSFRTRAPSVWTTDGWEGCGFASPFTYKGLTCLPCTGRDDLEIRDSASTNDGFLTSLWDSVLRARASRGVHTQVLHLEPHTGAESLIDALQHLVTRVREQGAGRFVNCIQAVERAAGNQLILGGGPRRGVFH